MVQTQQIFLQTAQKPVVFSPIDSFDFDTEKKALDRDAAQPWCSDTPQMWSHSLHVLAALSYP